MTTAVELRQRCIDRIAERRAECEGRLCNCVQCGGTGYWRKQRCAACKGKRWVLDPCARERAYLTALETLLPDEWRCRNYDAGPQGRFYLIANLRTVATGLQLEVE